LIPLALILLSFTQKQLADNPVVLDGIDSRYASEYILITTPAGIYTFDRNAQTWKSITTAHGLPDNKARIVGLDQGILWVATESGLASADIRLNDWRTYTLPAMVSGLAFDDNYVWITGEFGLKRFDKYVETWEDIAETPANDILFDQTYLWLATPQGILRYNPEFENIENMYAAPKHDYYYIIETRSRIWFLSAESFTAYEKTNESWSEYPAFEITDYSVIGDSLFILSDNIVHLYNPATNSWGPFVELEGLVRVNGLSLSPRVSNSISFATDQGLILYEWREKTRRIFNHANGLYNDTLTDAYESNEFIFAIGQNNIQYLDKNTGIWQIEQIATAKGTRGKFIYHDEAGLHAGLIDDLDVRLEGRAYYSLSSIITDTTAWSDYSTMNLRLIGQHKSNRTLSLYYDDTNKEDTLYGFGYRGLESDFLYRANGGFIESEYYEFDLLPTYSTFGANVRLRHDAHNLMLQGGQLKSSFRNDFFYGRALEKHDTILDIQYSRNTFYRINSGLVIDPTGFDTVFVDDQQSATNDLDTRVGYAIAGITGDFDPLINGLHYFIDYERGFIQLLNAVGDSAIVILKSNGQEVIIQSDSVRDNILENIYSLGVDIIPGSFQMNMIDTLGQSYPLSDFGIDNDSDGRVDAEFINYKLGYLIFPQPRPFPDEVYENDLNIYLADYEFSTQSVFYRLSRQPVLIGSEKVFVDGEQMVREFHYIIDYTSGTVLFLSEEAVNDFSEVEIKYLSVERARDDVFYSAQPNIKLGENINLSPGYTKMVDEQSFHLSGKYQTTAHNRSLIFVPQAAVNQDREFAQDYKLIANYRTLTLNAQYQGYSEGFESFGISERRYGNLRKGANISLVMEPISYLRLNTTLKKESLVDSLGSRNSTQYLSGRIDYLNPHLPNGFVLVAKNTLPDHDKLRLQLNANYNLELSANKIRINSVARQDMLTFASSEKKTLEYIVNTNIALRFPVRADIYLHGIDLYDNDRRDKDESEARLAINVDAIPGLYYTGNYRQKRITYFLPESKDMSITHYLYNNLNIAPGRWYAPLSIINLSLGNGSNFDEYLDDMPLNRNLSYLIFEPVEEDITTLTDLRTVYVKVYLTPLSNLNIQLKRAVNSSGTARYYQPILRKNIVDEIRAEYEQARIGYLTAVYNRTENRLYPVQLTQNVYMEWTKPWTAMFRTKLTGNLRTDTYEYTSDQTKDAETNIRMETLLRFGRRSYLNISLAGRRQDRYIGGITNSVLPGCGIYLNLLEFLFLQFDYEANIVIDESTTHLLSAKITGSF
jgi:hypothetical protein